MGVALQNSSAKIITKEDVERKYKACMDECNRIPSNAERDAEEARCNWERDIGNASIGTDDNDHTFEDPVSRAYRR